MRLKMFINIVTQNILLTVSFIYLFFFFFYTSYEAVIALQLKNFFKKEFSIYIFSLQKQECEQTY